MSMEQVTLSIHNKLSLHHIWDAAHFARLCIPFEKTFADILKDNWRFQWVAFEYQAYVVHSILSTAGFLEAFINELYVDSVENVMHGISIQLQSSTKASMKTKWLEWTKNNATGREHKSVTTKYKEALNSHRENHLTTGLVGQDLINDIELFVRMRNMLFHYKPQTKTVFDSEQPEFDWQDEADLRLLREKFNHYNPFQTHETFRKYLSYGCAKWGIETSFKFLNEFLNLMNLTDLSIIFRDFAYRDYLTLPDIW